MSKIIDALDDYFAFKRREENALDNGLAGYVYGHLEFNKFHEKQRNAIDVALQEALAERTSQEPKT